ncbi:hypothetical protein [Virgibacillus litoralis]|uniref:DUF3139 domain-containing protein n=1 Tax=Virgibacillus litoralis TaxID=578221 RepID=A0ABS4H9D7_9BACI|nr:hypothetical protein [Virgibacillus litoralis]MBP1947514.1 hypothetical protein [Virgibacillus litoralis]
MGVKGKLGILVLTSVVIVSVCFWYTQNKLNLDREVAISTEVKKVVGEVSDKYQVHNTSIVNGGKNPTISINVYDKNNVPRVKSYLKTNLSEDDLEHYEVDVFSNRNT